ncbi:MAG: esterase, partial [Achromobacter mucicolens]
MASSSSIEFLPDPGVDVRQLFILLHGVGGSPANLEPLAQAVRAGFPSSAVLIPEGFEPFDGGGAGRQWFSVRGVTDDNRVDRVAQALPRLEAYVHDAQARF